MHSTASSAGSLPVDVVEMARVFLVVCLCVTWFCENIPTVHLAIVLVMIWDEAPYVQINAVSVGHGTVIRMMVSAFAVVATVKYRALERGVGSVGDLAVRTLARSDGTGSGAKGALTRM